MNVQRETDVRTSLALEEAEASKGKRRNPLDDDGGDGPSPGASEIMFDEYCEIIGALAVIYSPDPYLPLNQRISNYIVRDFLPCFYPKVHGLRRIPIPAPVDPSVDP